MKKIIIIAIFSSFVLLSCEKKEEIKLEEFEVENTDGVELAENVYESFGDEITAEGAISQAEMLKKYESMKPGDTINIKFASKVNAVCKMKGCWMRLDLAPETEAMVKFKDYAYFVPKNAEESDAVVEGKAFVTEMSVEDQQHYAKDEGKTETEIAAITEPKMTYEFEANGVLLK